MSSTVASIIPSPKTHLCSNSRFRLQPSSNIAHASVSCSASRRVSFFFFAPCLVAEKLMQSLWFCVFVCVFFFHLFSCIFQLPNRELWKMQLGYYLLGGLKYNWGRSYHLSFWLIDISIWDLVVGGHRLYPFCYYVYFHLLNPSCLQLLISW